MKKEFIAITAHASLISAIVGYDIWNMIAGFPPTWSQIITADLYIIFWSWAFVIAAKEDI